jgi:hypothetical protein
MIHPAKDKNDKPLKAGDTVTLTAKISHIRRYSGNRISELHIGGRDGNCSQWQIVAVENCHIEKVET